MIKRRVSEFQFDIISENTKVGIQVAKLKGKNTGRLRKPDHNVRRAMEMYQSKKFYQIKRGRVPNPFLFMHQLDLRQF
mgnify:CR=1 FL=1